MIIYTDGSYNRKAAKNACGYSAIIIKEETPTHYIADILYGVNTDPEYAEMWNVGGELWAVLSGVDYILENLSPDQIDLYYDYQGIESWASGLWRAKKSLTQSYARHMRELRKSVPIHFHKVKGHSNVLLNETADEYAKRGISDYLKNPSKQTFVLNDIHISRQ